MLRRTWQASMIALARSAALKRLVQGGRATSSLAQRYVAGTSAEDAVARAAALLRERRIRASLYYLGEYVDSPALVAEAVEQKLRVAGALAQAGLDVHVSVDPTQIGLCLDPALARDNAFRIAQGIAAVSAGRAGIHCAMLDMEDQGTIDATLALHDALSAVGLPAAVTLQADLRRTEADLRARLRPGARLRLVKGAFAAGADVAFVRREEIKANYRRLIDLMLSPAARDSGFYPIIATHDDRLQDYAADLAERRGWPADGYEFEMMLGVRGDVAERLAQQGRRVRLYVAFGRDWWPFAVRRIGENPRNAALLLRSLVGRA